VAHEIAEGPLDGVATEIAEGETAEVITAVASDTAALPVERDGDDGRPVEIQTLT